MWEYKRLEAAVDREPRGSVSAR